MDLNRPRRRPRVRRAVVVLPSAFTLGNLFFGFWSMVSASKGNFMWAGWFLVLAGVMDMLDGRIARLSKTDSRFGAELDSLVDVISFGVAPAVLMYHLEFAAAGGFAWLVCYAYVVAVAIRLARFNLIAETKEHSAWFNGLPSPSAGMILGVYYPFSQTSWYAATLGGFNGQVILVLLILLLSVLMMSNVRYPKLPGIGFRSMRGRMGLALNLSILTGGILVPEYFFFPFGMAYVTYGLARATILGFLERGDNHDQAPLGTEDEHRDPPVSLYDDSTTRRSDHL
jgi:CDP-diacylglycerol--serine O-phosphatidyltransferase